MRRPVVFVGPTLGAREVAAALDADVRPPAARGDVLRATLDAAPVIGLVDGYFDHVAGVWHKEILWALSRGVRVYGAASMGALRAAELAPFGMRGVGLVAEMFATGALNDDDEVAVAHRDAEGEHAPVTEAMVNVRATLAHACGAGVLCDASRDALGAVARSLHFSERTWGVLLAAGRARGVSAPELDALRDWLPAGRVDLKRRDALEMLARIAAELRDAPPAEPPRWRFEYTDAWHALLSEVRAARAGGVA